jgi:putative transposase
MRREVLRGITRSRSPRTTIPGPLSDRPEGLVRRAFTAPAPNCLWVAEITYIRTFSGWVYAGAKTAKVSTPALLIRAIDGVCSGPVSPSCGGS